MSGRWVIRAAALLMITAALGLPLAAAEETARPSAAGEPGAARAIEAAAEAAPAPAGPSEVVTGLYVNDILDIDFKTNSFSADFYVWFRWKGGDASPAKTMEFMNRFQPNDHLRESLLEEPKEMPDGSRYAIIRAQGRFSSKFQLEHYPFDRQELAITFEDTTNNTAAQVYKPDQPAVMLNPAITLPGFRIGAPRLSVVDNPYPTNFGDLSVGNADSYSRAIVTIPVTRPLGALTLKTFVPVLLIILCAGLALIIRPQCVDGRIGLAITALLTLVALQLTGGSGLPDVDYLMMLDKVYLVSYAFIMLVLLRVTSTSWRVDESTRELKVARNDRRMVVLLGSLYLISVAAIGGWSLSLVL